MDKWAEMLKANKDASEAIDWNEYGRERMKPFNLAERIAIVSYLEYRAATEYDADEINQALANYWWPSVRSGR